METPNTQNADTKQGEAENPSEVEILKAMDLGFNREQAIEALRRKAKADTAFKAREEAAKAERDAALHNAFKDLGTVAETPPKPTEHRRIPEQRPEHRAARFGMTPPPPKVSTVPTTYGYELGREIVEVYDRKVSGSKYMELGIQRPIFDPFLFSEADGIRFYPSNRLNKHDISTAVAYEPKRDAARAAWERWIAAHADKAPGLLEAWKEALSMHADETERVENKAKRQRYLTDYLPWAFEHAGAAWIDVNRWATGEYVVTPALKAVRGHLQSVGEEWRSPRPFLTLIGSNGVGKSTSVVLALLEHQADTWEYCASGYRSPAVFWNAQEMATGEMFDKRTHALIERAKTAPVLVVNEFACEPLYERGPWASRLASVLDARYSAGRVTILTTNKDWEGIKAHYQEHGLNSIVSRIRGGKVVKINGEDMRHKPPAVERRASALGMTAKPSVSPRSDDLRGKAEPGGLRNGSVRAEDMDHSGAGSVEEF